MNQIREAADERATMADNGSTKLETVLRQIGEQVAELRAVSAVRFTVCQCHRNRDHILYLSFLAPSKIYQFL